MASTYSTALQKLLVALPARERIDPLRILPASLWPTDQEDLTVGEQTDLTLAPIGATGSPARLVERSFGFLDMVEFTSTVARLSPEETLGLMTVFRQLVREVAASRACRVSRWVGDGVFIVGLEPGQVIACMVELSERLKTADVNTCAGVASGEVLLFEAEDYLGSPINIAARLCDAARPGQVLADESVIEHLPTWVESKAPVSLKLKGLGKMKGYPIRAVDPLL